MHILILSHEFAHPKLNQAGGIGNFLADYTQRLAFEGHQVTVIGYNKIHLEEKYNGVDLLFFKSSITSFYKQIIRLFHKLSYSQGNIPFYAKDKIQLAKKVKDFCLKNKVDIIEVNDYLGDGAFLDVEIPVVMRTHGAYKVLQNEIGLRENKAFTFFEEEQLKKVNAICSVSQTSAEFFKKYFDYKNEITVIHNGVQIVPELQKTKSNRKRIFYFGTFSEAKGSDRLVEIINNLNFDNYKISLAGKTEEDFNSLIKSNLKEEKKEEVNFLGFLNQEELYQVLSESDIILFPSRLENFSIALLEAMVHKNLCLCWDIPSFNEVIINNKNGFIVNSVSEAIDKIDNLDIETLELIQKNARETVLKSFSKNKMIDNSLNFYQKQVQ